MIKEPQQEVPQPPIKKTSIVEYKALLNGKVKYLTKKDVMNTSRKCHRCRYVARTRHNSNVQYAGSSTTDLNACINIAHKVMRPMGWRRCEPRGPACVTRGAKPTLNAGSSRL